MGRCLLSPRKIDMKISSSKSISPSVKASPVDFAAEPKEVEGPQGSSASSVVDLERAPFLSLPPAMPRGIHFPPGDILTALVRAKLSDTLVSDFTRVPEVFEGLVEFFSDLVRHDPRRARLLGISHPENF